MKKDSWKTLCFCLLIPMGTFLTPVAVALLWGLSMRLDFLPDSIIFLINLFLFLLFLVFFKYIPKKYYFSRGILLFLMGVPSLFMSIGAFFEAIKPGKPSFDDAFHNECEDCAHITKLMTKNGEQLDINRGITLGKAQSGGWQNCSCGQSVSYEKNSKYAISQIEKMGDYWQHLPDCSSYTLYDYAEQTSFDLKGECYLHKEKIRESAEITIIYNIKTNKLLYLYYDW